MKFYARNHSLSDRYSRAIAIGEFWRRIESKWSSQ